MKKLAIITSHPIQYNAPLFKLISERGKIKIKVFYTWSQAIEQVQDHNFGKAIKWDIPLLDGYDFDVVENISKKPGTYHRKGIINPELVAKIESWKPDAVLVYGWNFISHFQVMKYFKGKVPVLFRGDSTLLDEKFNIKSFIRRIYLKYVYQFVDYALYVGTNNRNYFLKHGLSEKQLVFAPHAVDNNRFADSSEKEYEIKAEKWRNDLGYSPNDIVILFAGKFELKKNPMLLIQAVSQISQFPNLPIIKLLMVGNGILERKIKGQASKDNNIKFLPFQNQTQMPILYRVADIYCLPSQGPGETWGLAVNEAMASARPVLVSNKVGCAADLLVEELNGMVFRNNNLDDLVAKIKKLILTKNSLKCMGNNAQKFISAWAYEKTAEAIENLLITKY